MVEQTETTNDTTQPQLPAWAIEAGWTEQDLADGWFFADEGYCRYAAIKLNYLLVAAWHSGDVIVSEDGEERATLVRATTPAAARTCALEILAAINRARGE